MQIGNVWLKIDSTGSNVLLEGVTPAEVAILNTNHEANARGVACHDLVITGEEIRTGEAEINRLREKYANAKDRKGESLAEKLYPGKSPTLPQKFEEVGLTVEKLEPKTTVAAVPPAPAPTQPPPAPVVEPTKTTK